MSRPLFGAMLTVGAATLLVRVAGLAREVVVAERFGTSDALDAYLIAILVPSFVVNILVWSATAALTPVYVRVRTVDGGEAARRLVGGFLFWGSLLLIGITVVLGLLAPVLLPVLGSGFGGDKLALTARLFLLALPLVLLGGWSSAATAVLHAEDRFGLPALVPLVVPVVAVAVLLAQPSSGIVGLMAATLAGSVLGVVLLAWQLRRADLWPPLVAVATPQRALGEVFEQFWPVVVGGLMMSGADLVDQSMAAMLAPGSVAALGYASRLVGALQGLGTVVLSAALLPFFSRLVAAGDWNGVRASMRRHGRLIILGSIPGTALLVLVSEPLVRLFFERGAFAARDTELVADVQRFLLLQLPFYALGILGVRVLNALGANRVLLWVNMLGLVANVVGNQVLMNVIGVAGIALSTSIAYVLTTAFIFWLIARRLPPPGLRPA